jgi:GMP synthase (glutamine-hydrolysing)
VFQWHEDGICLPPGTVHLASSPASKVQAFRYGEHAYGFQFHLEVDRSLIERWLLVPENKSVLDDEQGRIDPDTIRQQTPKSIDALQTLSRQTFSRWIDKFEMTPRRHTFLSK